ncbi:MAG: 1-acyl-sn-glycerol-3-phosphate acyltransferase [Bacteroidota bacterium]
MPDIFIHIYRLFQRRKWLFYLFLSLLTLFILFFGSRIRFEENIAGSVSGNKKEGLYETVISNFKFADKLVVHLSLNDRNAAPDPDSLIAVARSLRVALLSRLDTGTVREVLLQQNDTLFQSALDLMDQHLPLFLDAADYKTLDSLMRPENLAPVLLHDYRMMISPAGMMIKQRIARDPLGISGLAMKKLTSLRAGDNFCLYNGSVFSADKKHLLMFITPARPSNETDRNAKLVSALETCVNELRSGHGRLVNVEFFGFAAVAVGNARQIKLDIFLTLLVAVVLIFLLTGWYFKNIFVPLLGFVPAFFGGGLALALLYLFKGSISFIALGIGSVVLGLIIDYALYMINHYRTKSSAEQTLRDMSLTILICSLTTIGVFLCLTFLGSAVLHDLGWFASISVFGASLCSLVVLPQFLGTRLLPAPGQQRETFIDKIAAIDPGKSRWLLAALAIAGIASLFAMHKVSFEQDMNALNFMTRPLKDAEKNIEQLSGGGLKNIYVVATGRNLNEALKQNETNREKLGLLRRQGKIAGFSGIGTLLFSDSTQRKRLATWSHFWTPERKSLLALRLKTLGEEAGFSDQAFAGAGNLVNASYTVIPGSQTREIRRILFSDWINETPGMTMISSVARVRDTGMQDIYQSFSRERKVVVFDRQNLATRFVLNVKKDFDLLVSLSMIFVTLLLLLLFGRIELALITSLPMFFSWLITLGFMGITGVRFNIFNIIISSFIFGLGVDYSILMMRGLLSRYQTGVDDMKTYRVSIILSSATTLIGVAALFFARHPALNSIALISVIGVVSIVIISFSTQSVLAGWFLLTPQKKGRYPKTARNILQAIFIAWIPISLIALALVIYSTLISPLLPLPRKRRQNLFHMLFRLLSSLYIKLNFPRYHAIENMSGDLFRKPALIICNHQSLIDTPAILRLHPKIVILTSEWVFGNMVFGPVARVAGFIPVSDHIDSSLELIRQRTEEGYSILIFPEGHRSPDGQIGRFHRGAFYIAEKLNLDILPVVMYGGGEFLPAGIFWGKPNRLFTRILPVITPGNRSFGTTYQERAKRVRIYLAGEYGKFSRQHNTAAKNAVSLRLNYLFKGPLLEWSLRARMMREHNFDSYCHLLPQKGNILDLGCGYGFIAYMLLLTSAERTITGVDPDEQKILTANNGYLKNDRISFIHSPIQDYPLNPMDGILVGDILSDLPYVTQEALIGNCFRNLKPGGIVLFRTRSGRQHVILLPLIRKMAAHYRLTQEITSIKHFNPGSLVLLRKPVENQE